MLYFIFCTRDIKTLHKCHHLGSKSTNAHLIEYAIPCIKIHLQVPVAFATINRVFYRNIWYNTSAKTAHFKPLSVTANISSSPYLCSLDNCCIFPVFLYSYLIMVAKGTETGWFILINDKSYFICVNLLVYYISLNIS